MMGAGEQMIVLPVWTLALAYSATLRAKMSTLAPEGPR